ncbi:hypothetical protein JQ615_16420 [Bradyrhizobium jicamae]|uniref:Uncharacterized protein n=1 Tax=Bradyrhizobium jicamae TaxID=280332 RepID=A0ABS5FJL1_9BRAD|nr:hypothetical protein [Bradyrhizobium jicamae]MBR0796978.1 hypothetical protein [Bradyrhizobium jicamae]MBR0937150.1 hypothetical protein [Bradyrhizobium jicamae]
MHSNFLSQLACRCRVAWAAVFGPMTRDDWLFLASIIWFHSLLVALIWGLYYGYL